MIFLIQILLFFLSLINNRKCDLIIKIFKDNQTFVEGFLYKSYMNNLIPIKFKKLDYNFQISLCSKLNYGNIHAMSYPKRLAETNNHFSIGCFINDCL